MRRLFLSSSYRENIFHRGVSSFDFRKSWRSEWPSWTAVVQVPFKIINMPKCHVLGWCVPNPFSLMQFTRDRTAQHWQFRSNPHLDPEQAVLKKPAPKWDKRARITWAAPCSLSGARKVSCCKKTTLFDLKRNCFKTQIRSGLQGSPTRELGPGLARPWALLSSADNPSFGFGPPRSRGGRCCTAETQRT